MSKQLTTQELSIRREKSKEYYRKHKERIRAWSKAHIEANKKQYNALAREYHRKNKEKCNLACKRYDEKHKEELKQKRAERYRLNKFKMSKKCSEKYFANHEENKQKAKQKRIVSRELRNNRHKERYITDIQYKLASIIRVRIYRAVKDSNTKRNESVEELIGCKLDVLKRYIENQFDCIMNWDNHSVYGWHIDHIKPINTFDLTDIEQQKICFHYTNLRPLWCTANLMRPKDGSDTSS
jgi:hypothetical protein